MDYHIILHRAFDLEANERLADLGQCPRHIMAALAQKLGAKVHAPGNDVILPIDRIRSKLLGSPATWAMARRLSAQLTSNDIVYCNSETTGIPLAAMCSRSTKSPTIVIYAHVAYRPLTQVALRLFPVAQKSVFVITNTTAQVEFLKQQFGLADDRVLLLLEQTDTQFFTPGLPSPDKERPIIASVGLERRDYRLLAAATSDMNVDVRITGFSADVRQSMSTFPASLPANMTTHTLEWIDLLKLYRNADIVALALTKSLVTSGVTTLLEAMACARPVIVTRTEGLVDYLKPSETVITVEPGDVEGLRKTIQYVLENTKVAAAIAQEGYRFVQAFHNSDKYVENLAQLLLSFS